MAGILSITGVSGSILRWRNNKITRHGLGEKRGRFSRDRTCETDFNVGGAYSGHRHRHRFCGAEVQDSRCGDFPACRHRHRPGGLGSYRYQGGFGALSDHLAVRSELYFVRWRRLAAIQYSQAGVDHDCRDLDPRRVDHRGSHRICRACCARPALDRGAAAGRGDWPRPIRRLWCRFSGRSTFATGWRKR